MVKYRLWKSNAGIYYAAWPGDRGTRRKSLLTKNIDDAVILMVEYEKQNLEEHLPDGYTKIKDWVKHIDGARKEKTNRLNPIFSIWESAKKRSARKGIDFELCYQDVVDLLVQSNGKCELSRLPFSLSNPKKIRVPPFKYSLDRIDAIGPYSTKNCRIVCFCVNWALNQWGECVFKKVAKSYFYANTLRILPSKT